MVSAWAAVIIWCWDKSKRHLLSDILAIAICAVICGADEWTEMEAFGKAKQAWLKTFLALPNGIPSHDTLARVLARLDRWPCSTASSLGFRA